MRLDKFLKISRLIKRRSVANDACDAGRVEVNGKVARASYDVKINDIININLGSNPIRIKVIDVKEFATKDNASNMYIVLSE